MRDVELWEAVALSLSYEPNELPVYLGAFDKLGDDPFRICPLPFLERLLVANSNCGISFGFKPVHKLKARCLVDLPEFASWAVKSSLPLIPPEFVAIAASEPKADAETKLPPAPKQDAATSTTGWKLKRPTRFQGYGKPLHDVLRAALVAGSPTPPKARDVLDSWKVKKPLEVFEVTNEGLKYEDAKGNIKEADLDAIRQAINRMID